MRFSPRAREGFSARRYSSTIPVVSSARLVFTSPVCLLVERAIDSLPRV